MFARTRRFKVNGCPNGTPSYAYYDIHNTYTFVYIHVKYSCECFKCVCVLELMFACLRALLVLPPIFHVLQMLVYDHHAACEREFVPIVCSGMCACVFVCVMRTWNVPRRVLSYVGIARSHLSVVVVVVVSCCRPTTRQHRRRAQRKNSTLPQVRTFCVGNGNGSERFMQLHIRRLFVCLFFRSTSAKFDWLVKTRERIVSVQPVHTIPTHKHIKATSKQPHNCRSSESNLQPSWLTKRISRLHSQTWRPNSKSYSSRYGKRNRNFCSKFR